MIQRSPACCPFHGGPTHLQTDLWEWEGAAGWTGNSPVLTEYGRVSGQQQQPPGNLLYWDYKVENSSIHFRLHKLWALNSESVTVTIRVNCIVIWLIKSSPDFKIKTSTLANKQQNLFTYKCFSSLSWDIVYFCHHPGLTWRCITLFYTLLLSQLWCGVGNKAEKEKSLEDTEHERNRHTGKQL